MEEMDTEGRKEDGVLLIYMFIAARRGGPSTCLRVSEGHVQLSTLLFPQQHFLTAHHADTQKAHTHVLISHLGLMGELVISTCHKVCLNESYSL